MDFQKFNKIPRLSREMTITEKIHGCNSSVIIIRYSELLASFNGEGDKSQKEEMEEFVDKYCLYKTLAMTDENDILYVFAGSRKRWLDCSSKGDNHGFAKWVKLNAEELLNLGEGRHFGEWMGSGINAKYGLNHKRFYLFNVKKWSNTEVRPKCCYVVPVLYEGLFDTKRIEEVLKELEVHGSYAVEGFKPAEGIVIFHKASGQLFKKTIKNDSKPKGLK